MYRILTSQKLFEPLRISFHQLFRLTHQLKCKEKRDNVFGLLAIPTTDNVAHGIVPDYKKSDAEVYRTVAWTLIKGSMSLDILSSVQHDFPQNKANPNWIRPTDTEPDDTKVPSWVPQWHFVLTQALGPLEPDASFAASCETRANIQSLTPDRLAVGGRIIEQALDIRQCTAD